MQTSWSVSRCRKQENWGKWICLSLLAVVNQAEHVSKQKLTRRALRKQRVHYKQKKAIQAYANTGKDISRGNTNVAFQLRFSCVSAAFQNSFPNQFPGSMCPIVTTNMTAVPAWILGVYMHATEYSNAQGGSMTTRPVVLSKARAR